MASNDEALEFLDYFCDEANSFDYALLIDAPWGSGKTHFVRSYLERRYPVTNPPAPRDYLWVSLFGKKDAAEVRDALFAEAHPMLSSKWGALLGSAAVGVVKKYAGVDFNDKSLQGRFLPDISAKLIVFDDLERTSMGAANALGLINGFVETGLFKIIVIANQSPFASDTDYRRQKEKVIGRTLTVMSDPAVVLKHLATKVRNASAQVAIETNSADLLAVFAASGLHNLRSMRAALDDFDRLVNKSDVRLGESPAALRELLLYLVAIGMEIRAAEVDAGGLGAFLEAAKRLGFDGKPDAQAAEARAMIAKYPNVDWRAPIIPPDVLGRLIHAGELAINEVNAGISNHPTIVGVAKLPNWLALWNWAQMSATAYQDARNSLLCQLCRFEIVHPGEILHVVGVILLLEEYGDRLLHETEQDLIDYIDALAWARLLTPDTEVFSKIQADSWDGHGYQKNGDPAFDRIRLHLREAVKLARKAEMALKAANLMMRLKTPDGHLDLYTYDQKNGRYGGVAILQNIPIADFADLLLDDFRLNPSLMAALHQRYELGRGYHELLDERIWLHELEAEIRRRASIAPAPFSNLLAQRADYWFSGIHDNVALNGH